MRIHVVTRGMELDEKLTDVLNRKLNKLDRYFEGDTETSVTFTAEKHRQRIEVTIPYKGILFRTERSSHNALESVDEVIDALDKQIQKYRTKLDKRLKTGAFDTQEMSLEEEIPSIVKNKRFTLKPMDVEEAALQLEMVGHSFFVFINAETEEVNVIYKRNDGNLGLIEPEY